MDRTDDMDTQHEDLLTQIMQRLHQDIFGIYTKDNPPSFNDIVVAHAYQDRPFTFYNQVARVVQIRKKSGQFGSDLYLLRLLDGTLLAAENQSFRPLPDTFYDHVSAMFTVTEEEESQAAQAGYIIKGVEHVGFWVSDSSTPVTPPDSFMITTTTR